MSHVKLNKDNDRNISDTFIGFKTNSNFFFLVSKVKWKHYAKRGLKMSLSTRPRPDTCAGTV